MVADFSGGLSLFDVTRGRHRRVLYISLQERDRLQQLAAIAAKTEGGGFGDGDGADLSREGSTVRLDLAATLGSNPSTERTHHHPAHAHARNGGRAGSNARGSYASELGGGVDLLRMASNVSIASVASTFSTSTTATAAASSAANATIGSPFVVTCMWFDEPTYTLYCGDDTGELS